MIYPDLAARTCGFMGVLGTLIVLGVMDTPEFLITPQSSFSPLELQISSAWDASSAEKISNQSAPAPESYALNSSKTVDKNLEASPLSPIEQQSRQTLLQQDVQQAPAKIKQNEPQTKDAADTLQDMAVIEHIPTHVTEDTDKSNPSPLTKPTPTSEPIKAENSQPNIAQDKIKTPKQDSTPTKTPAVSHNKAQAKESVVKKERVEVIEPNPAKKRNVETKQAVNNPSTLDKSHTAATESTKSVAADTPRTNSSNAAKPTNGAISQQLQEQRLQSQIASLLVQEIKRKLRYPKNAVRRKLEGIVQVEFTVEQGRISNFRINKSSGHKILDDAAKKLAQGMLHMTIPLKISQTVVVVPIKYELL